MIKEYNYRIKDQDLKITIGKVAEQANGACLVQLGETIVLVTATASKSPRQGVDFFPLMCDFEEKLYSVGKIPGGFIKREGRPSEKAILTARLIDRPIRPLFPDGYRNDVQLISTVLSVDQDNAPDLVAMIGSSVALSISDIPFFGPTGSITVAMVNDQYILNPSQSQRENSRLHLTVSGTKDAIMMVEAGCQEVTEAEILEAIMLAHEEIKKMCAFIESIVSEVGKEKKSFIIPEIDLDFEEEIRNRTESQVVQSIRTADKMERQNLIDQIKSDTIAFYAEIKPDSQSVIESVIEGIVKKEVRRLILEEAIRPDNRGLDEVRPIKCEIAVLPRTHGSGLFSRGQTQVLTIATLGAPGDVQVLDGLMDEENKRYMHQYNFPPFSVGDVKPLRSPGRREIGHGALAERAMLPVLPTEDEFPYTIRLVSEVLSSNGSSSQASICGSTLALLDAGVPIKKPVAGIAMGLIIDANRDKVAILTDIQGFEDHLGDMDFKVAGTADGITALQMDIKISGIDKFIIEEALNKANQGRMHILSTMNQCIDKPREDISKYAPRIFKLHINPEKIREVIGPGGKVINKIIDETGVKIDTYDDGGITITADTTENGNRAIEMIQKIVKEIQVGEIYLGKVTRIMNFGAFVDIFNGKEGLLHISHIAHERIQKVEDVLHIGDEVMVKVIEIDKQGRINLSRKVLLPREPKENAKPEFKKPDRKKE